MTPMKTLWRADGLDLSTDDEHMMEVAVFTSNMSLDMDGQFNALLAKEARNACLTVGPDNPLAVAHALPQMVAALQRSTISAHRPACVLGMLLGKKCRCHVGAAQAALSAMKGET